MMTKPPPFSNHNSLYVPVHFIQELQRRKAPKMDLNRIWKYLEENHVKLPTDKQPFLTADELIKRYDFPVPSELCDLWRIADDWLLENISCRNAEYYRSYLNNWEYPEVEKNKGDNILFDAFIRRFKWNVFGNMQLWEHFVGVALVAIHHSSGRFYASTFSSEDGTSPVFFMDHETAELTGCVSSSISTFWRVQYKDDQEVSFQEKELLIHPEIHDRSGSEEYDEERENTDQEDKKVDYLECTTSFLTWPLFHAKRSQWIIASFLDPYSIKTYMSDREVYQFDFEKEKSAIGKNEPVSLYWLCKTALCEEKDLFQETHSLIQKQGSRLIKEWASYLQETFEKPIPKGWLEQTRKALKATKYDHKLQKN